MKNGDIKPLFINKSKALPLNIWMDAENHPTKGYAIRKGWHCTLTPEAPHLSMRGRAWYQVEIDDYEYYNRPESQGGTWVLAQRMRIIKPLLVFKPMDI